MTSRASSARRAAFRAFTVMLVLVGLAVCWELYRFIWSSAGWTWPFPVDSTTMPHLWTIAKAFGQPAQVNQPALITILLHKSLFTAKEAAVGFAIGAVVGFVLGIVLAHSRLLQRGFLPYIVASQTIPILAIAPTVVNVLVADGVLVAKPGVGRFVPRAKFGEELKPPRGNGGLSAMIRFPDDRSEQWL